jgi:hypothetical protein
MKTVPLSRYKSVRINIKGDKFWVKNLSYDLIYSVV